MPAVIIRALLSFLVPGGLIFTVAVLVVSNGLIADSLPALAAVYPYAVLVAGLVLGWRFGRSRLVFTVLVLVASDIALHQFVSAGAGAEVSGDIVVNSIALLLPLNLALFCYAEERGFLTSRGVLRIALIVLQVMGIVYLYQHPQSGIVPYLDYQLLNSELLQGVPLSQPALLGFIAATFLVSIRYIHQRNPVEGGFFWALVTVFYSLSRFEIGPESTVFLSTAGLILVASVIESSHGMAFLDELTGLPGRRALNEYYPKLGNRYVIGMVDIDLFKKFNDKYGHDVGDQVLRMVASRISKVSGGGKAFRYGGEEFTVVFPGKQLDETLPHLERLRKAIAEEKFVLRGRGRPKRKPENPKAASTPRHGVRITVSIGAAERSARNASAKQVVVAADKALYRAKQKGRNKVCSWPPGAFYRSGS